jgi:hypothetical protein
MRIWSWVRIPLESRMYVHGFSMSCFPVKVEGPCDELIPHQRSPAKMSKWIHSSGSCNFGTDHKG